MDVLVHGEGEPTFADILLSLLDRPDLSEVKGITYQNRDSKLGFEKNPPRPRIDDLGILPSPFLDGTMDPLLRDSREHVTGTVWETNRGCPFQCTFCDWGDASVNRVAKYDIERLFEELRWISRNEIGYIFGADANFGIFYERDLEIAKGIAESSDLTPEN